MYPVVPISSRNNSNNGGKIMAERLGNFLLFLVLSLITLGLYPIYFFVTRQQETVSLLEEIRDELKRQ